MSTPNESDEVLHCMLTDRLKKAVNDIVECRKKEEELWGAKYPGTITAYVNCPFKKMDQFMSDAGASHIGEGSYRRVYSFNDDKCVVKIPRNRDARNDNMLESDVWKYSSPDVKQYLVPVADADKDGEYLTMPKVKTNYSVPYRRRVVRELETRLDNVGVECQDLHIHNVGTWHGRPVILDYDGVLWDCLLRRPVGERPPRTT